MIDLESIVRHAPAILVRLALAHVKTVEGARRIYYAEVIGRNRLEVLRMTDRRIAELQGQEKRSTKPIIAVKGEAIEKPTPRIVEAVGKARRHPGW